MVKKQSDIEAKARETVKAYLEATGQKPSIEEFMALVAQARASLEGEVTASAQGKAPVERNRSAKVSRQAPSPVSALSPVSAPRPRMREKVSVIDAADPNAGEVHRHLIGVKPRKARADCELKKPGREYWNQRDAFVDGPAVPVELSYTNSYVICLEDGQKMKMLRRHLKTYYGMTPEEYLDKWGLPKDYPLVAPDHRETRSRIAKIQAATRGSDVAVGGER